MNKVFAVCVMILMSIASLGQTENASSLKISFPGKTWAVAIAGDGFTVESNGPKADGRQYLLAKNPTTGVILSITLEKTAKGADASGCPEFLRRRIEAPKAFTIRDVKYGSFGNIHTAQYLIAEAQGVPIKQENLVACTAKEDIFVDVHLSKVQYKPEDARFFSGVVESVRLDATAPPQSAGQEQNSLTYLEAGSKMYQQQRYADAIVRYAKALELEKQQRKLDADLWRVLVDNLGMSYGVTGDLEKAEATFRYGLSQDPSYPLFYYNLACTYAERNDLETTIKFLKQAFEHKANVIQGESMPDPRTDDSFQRFLKEPKFQELLKSL